MVTDGFCPFVWEVNPGERRVGKMRFLKQSSSGKMVLEIVSISLSLESASVRVYVLALQG
jgi:hypothetical protein